MCFGLVCGKLDLCVKNLDLYVENLVKSLEKKCEFFIKILQGPFTCPYYSLAKTLQIDLKIQTFYICTFSRFSIKYFKVRRDVDIPLKRPNRIRPY